MSDFLKSSGRRLRAGWFWPLALLTFPMCFLDSTGLPGNPDGDPVAAFDPGPSPASSAIMCDIPKPNVEEVSQCADAEEAAMGMSLAYAAIALNLGETNPLVLDFSPSAMAECAGMPKKVDFFGPFPDGSTVCLNCGTQIPAVYPGAFDVCVAQCKDLINFGALGIPAEGTDLFCTQNVRVSTNFNKDTCFEGFCSVGGTPVPNASDPRRDPENLTWVDAINATATGSTVTFTGPETGGFSGGAASEQLITLGDAWVEFEAGETGVSHAVGLRTSCPDVVVCPDTDATLADLSLVLSLNVTGEVNIVENGAVLAGPFAPYAAGERFRIRVTDHNDGTADVAFFRYASACTPNMPCSDPPFYSYTGAARPSYPLRVDAVFREANASLTNATIMRIK